MTEEKAEYCTWEGEENEQTLTIQGTNAVSLPDSPTNNTLLLFPPGIGNVFHAARRN